MIIESDFDSQTVKTAIKDIISKTENNEASILDDYNLSEIAEDENITRQGVHDAIKRACKQLRGYEEKLGLVAKFEKQKELVKKLHVILKEMNTDDGELKEVFSIIDEILDEE